MKKLFSLSALLFVGLLAFNSAAFGWGAASGDGSNYRQLQETAVFFNNSGSSLSEGTVVVLDTGGRQISGNGAATGTTLGSYVRMANAMVDAGSIADHILAVGVVVGNVAVADQRPVVVVTKGPALTTVDDSTDAVTRGVAVGTSSGTVGRAGGGTNLGIALEAGDGTDGSQMIVWVAPTGAD